MADHQKAVMITGQVTHQPEIRATPKGSYSATFSLDTTTRTRKRGGGYITRHKRHFVVAYADNALDIRSRVRKGSHLQIEGKFELKEWEAKGTGEKKYLSQIILDRFSVAEPAQANLRLAA
jgi:single-strand DNA-binding protein